MARNIPPPSCLATGIGALPHRDPDAACRDALDCFPRFPYIPTLPNRGPLEGIVFSESAQLPGLLIRDGRLYVDSRSDNSAAQEQVFADYLDGNSSAYPAESAYASAFHAMMTRRLPDVLALKYQVTGPVTFGMQVVDCGKRPIFYDPLYADLLGKLIGLRARWLEQEMQARTGAPATLIVLSEPYLATLGSSVVPLDKDAVRSAIGDVAALLEGGLGIHCCSNTDWGFLFSLDAAVLSFDAYANVREFLLYPEDLARYLEQGGVVAWGIVPAEHQVFAQETPDSLYDRFVAIKRQVSEYVDEDRFLAQSLITPTCGIRTTDVPGAIAIMRTAAAIAERAREAIS